MTTPAKVEVTVQVDGKLVIVSWTRGTTTDRDRFNPDAKKRRLEVARSIGIDDGTLLCWIDAARKTAEGGDARPQKFDVVQEEKGCGLFIVRDKEQTNIAGEKFNLLPVAVLNTLLPTIANEKILVWSDASSLCCLDIDYHGIPVPHEAWATTRVIADVAPRPFAWHFSKSGGLHLFYLASGEFAADELAAAAALRWRAIDPTAGLELKTQVRGPGDKPVQYDATGQQDTSALLAGWLTRSEADTVARDEWLASENMEIGRRYDHTRCPINPTPMHASTGEPVVIGEDGIFCHRCNGEGKTLGCRKPGWASWTSVLGGPNAGDLGRMVMNLTHWGHARWVLTEKYNLPYDLARRAYSAALKAAHYGKPSARLVPLVFERDTEQLVRINNLWQNLGDGSPTVCGKDIGPILATLPAACTVDDKGAAKPKMSTVALFNQNIDLTNRGLPPVEIVHGFRMTRPWLADALANRTLVALAHDDVRARGARFLPEYVKKSQRMKLDEAWARVEEVLPGIDHDLVYCTMCAISCAQETRVGMQPFLFVSGSSGVAKTSTMQAAAAIMAAPSRDVVFEQETARFRQNISDGARSNGLLLLNEIIKDTMRVRGAHRTSAREALDPLLNLTENSASWVAYQGPVKMGRLPAIGLTEPVLPMSLRDETQIARRIWHKRIFGLKTSWPETRAKHGVVKDLSNLRLVSVEMADACNALLSDVCDRFFYKMQSWDVMADELGIKTIEKSDDFTNPIPDLREFFRQVCRAPGIDNARLAKRYPNGYKKISRNSEANDELLAQYNIFADGLDGANWMSSRRLTEKDWASILGTDAHVWLDLTNDGSNLYVRFRVGRLDKPTAVNEAIVNPEQWELPT